MVIRACVCGIGLLSFFPPFFQIRMLLNLAVNFLAPCFLCHPTIGAANVILSVLLCLAGRFSSYAWDKLVWQRGKKKDDEERQRVAFGTFSRSFVYVHDCIFNY